MRNSIAVLAVFFFCNCSVVRRHSLEPDYALHDQQSIKRLILVVAPYPAGKADVAELFGKIATRYVNMKRNFLIISHSNQAAGLDLKSICTEGIHGVLWVDVHAAPEGENGFQSLILSKLIRCSDGGIIWSAEAGGSFPAADSGLKEVAANYGKELGEGVIPYVPTAMQLLRPMFDTLPQPILTDDDVTEKMGLDD